MAVKIEKFNNLDFLLVDMVVVCGSEQSLEKIQDFIEASLEDFVRAHREELVAALDSDYEDLPDVPSFDYFYRTTLKPEVRKKMAQSGFGEEEIKSILSYCDGLFYRVYLPSARSR